MSQMTPMPPSPCTQCPNCGGCSCETYQALPPRCAGCSRDELHTNALRKQAAEETARWQSRLDQGATYAVPEWGPLLHRYDCPTIPAPDRQRFYQETGIMKDDGTIYWSTLPELFTAGELRRLPKRRRNCRICKPDPI